MNTRIHLSHERIYPLIGADRQSGGPLLFYILALPEEQAIT